MSENKGRATHVFKLCSHNGRVCKEVLVFPDKSIGLADECWRFKQI